MMSAGRRFQNDASALEPREEDELAARRSIIPAVIRPRDPIRSLALPGERGDEDDEDRHRKERGSGLDRGVAEDVLHVERDEEEDAEHRERDEKNDKIRTRVGPAPEELERQHRLATAPLDDDEGHERDDGENEDARRCAADVQPYVFASMRPYVNAKRPIGRGREARDDRG